MKLEKRTINSNDIFQGFKIIEIIHEKTVYVLRITKDNKLILTK